jgi:hypothetical protein
MGALNENEYVNNPNVREALSGEDDSLVSRYNILIIIALIFVIILLIIGIVFYASSFIGDIKNRFFGKDVDSDGKSNLDDGVEFSGSGANSASGNYDNKNKNATEKIRWSSLYLGDGGDDDSKNAPVNVSPCHDNDEDGYDNCSIGEPSDDGRVLDCDDDEFNVFYENPGAVETLCDGKDNDCDGVIDDGFDQDDCSYLCDFNWTKNLGEYACCGDDIREGGTYELNEVLCDGKDNDCDGVIDEGCSGCTPETRRSCGTNTGTCVSGIQRCNYLGYWESSCIGAIMPEKEFGESELYCDNLDQDCDGDDYCAYDFDGDGFVGIFSTVDYFEVPGRDCYDYNSNANPSGVEILCNGVDEDCNGIWECGCVDNDKDKDYGYNAVNCPSGFDKDDSNPLRFRGAVEWCNGIDEDFDSLIDEDCINFALTFRDSFEENPRERNTAYYNGLRFPPTGSSPWNGFTYIDATNEDRVDGSKSLKHIFNGDKVYSGDSVNLNYNLGLNYLNNGGRILTKSLPHGFLMIKITNLENAQIIIGSENHTFTSVTDGWYNLSLKYYFDKNNDNDAQDLLETSLPISIVPLPGKYINETKAEFFIDDYHIYADERNERWYSLQKIAGYRERAELKAFDYENGVSISSTGISGEIDFGLVPGETEHFSILFNGRFYDLSASISNLIGTRHRDVIDKSNVDVKWSGNKNGNYNNFDFHYSGSFLVNDPNLLGTGAKQDSNNLVKINLPHSKTSKLWFSLDLAEDITPDNYIGEINVTHRGSNIIVPIKVEVYDFSLSDSMPIRVGFFTKQNNYSDSALEWMRSAGVTDIWIGGTAPHMRYQPDSETYSKSYWDPFYKYTLRYQKYGINTQNTFLNAFADHELWRYVWAVSDKYHLFDKYPNWNRNSPWIGEGLVVKADYNNKFWWNDVKRYLYVYENTGGENLQMQIPLMEILKDKGYYWQATIRASEFFNRIEPESNNPHLGVWNNYTAKYGIRIGDYVDFWVMSERYYPFNMFLKRIDGKTAATSGYPSTNVKNYAVMRNEFWRTYLSGAEYHFNYALDDQRGDALGNQERWDLISYWNSNMNLGIVENEGSEGFIRGHWDLRYFQTLIELVERADSLSISNSIVEEARDATEIINTNMGWGKYKYEMVRIIKKLKTIEGLR